MHGKRSWGAPEDEGELRHRATHSPRLCSLLVLPWQTLHPPSHAAADYPPWQPVGNTPAWSTSCCTKSPTYPTTQHTTQTQHGSKVCWGPENTNLDGHYPDVASRVGCKSIVISIEAAHKKREGGACYDNIYGDSGPGCNKAPGITLFTALPLY